MRIAVLVSVLGAALVAAPMAIAQVPQSPSQENQPSAPQPVLPLPYSGQGEGGQGGATGAEPRAGEQGREDAAPPVQGGGCQFRERKLELIV